MRITSLAPKVEYLAPVGDALCKGCKQHLPEDVQSETFQRLLALTVCPSRPPALDQDVLSQLLLVSRLCSTIMNSYPPETVNEIKGFLF